MSTKTKKAVKVAEMRSSSVEELPPYVSFTVDDPSGKRVALFIIKYTDMGYKLSFPPVFSGRWQKHGINYVDDHVTYLLVFELITSNH